MKKADTYDVTMTKSFEDLDLKHEKNYTNDTEDYDLSVPMTVPVQESSFE